MKQKVLIIAEAGVNHNGDYALAEKLVEEAAKAGADFVKFQTFKADKLVSPDAQKAGYQKANVNDGNNSQYEMLKKLEMPESWHFELKKLALGHGIAFLSTGFDEESIDFLDELGMPFYKIPSGEIVNGPLLNHIAKKKKPVILSTGMATTAEIWDALDILRSNGVPDSEITLLHCNTEYPTHMQDVNLLAIRTMEKEFNVPVGYSDHTMGIEVPIAAVALGAVVIEKHFTTDRNLPGPDHKASLEPAELAAMVSAIRNIEKAISMTGEKKPTASESKNIAAARKSIFLKESLRKGDVITNAHIIMKRPGDGISPMRVKSVVGHSVNKDLPQFHKLDWSDII